MNSFAKEVWDTLSRIDVSPHVEHMAFGGTGKGMSYVPWHKAWMLLKRHYPTSTYRHLPDTIHSDGTMEVEVEVSILSDDPQVLETCYKASTNARLAVMDNKFKAIPNPNARDINDNRQRCLVKALAFMGLGLSLWDAGSTVPVGTLSDPVNAKQLGKITRLIADSDSDTELFLKWAGVDKLDQLPVEKFDQAVSMLTAKRGAK
jgi:hypothetical protein